jgi:hypothetical protein
MYSYGAYPVSAPTMPIRIGVVPDPARPRWWAVAVAWTLMVSGGCLLAIAAFCVALTVSPGALLIGAR